MADIFKQSAQKLNSWIQKRKVKRHIQTVENIEPDYSAIFAGKWAFIDSQTKKEHTMTIDQDLNVAIDHKVLDGHLIGLNSNLLTFLDHYGFQLKIFAQSNRPIKIYDESSGETYDIVDRNGLES